MHLANGDLVQSLEPLILRQFHIDELRVHTFNVGKDEELFDVGVITDIAFEFGIGVAPLPGSLAKESDVEQISFVGIGDGGLSRRS